MQLEWILSPLAQCIFIALTLIGCLALFLSVKWEIATLRHSFQQSHEEAAVSTATQAIQLATLRREMTAPEVNLPAGQELNLTRRTQALRMDQRGESPATIAAALRVPRNEIELLLKINRLTNDPGTGTHSNQPQAA